jgi:hypothetical protein
MSLPSAIASQSPVPEGNTIESILYPSSCSRICSATSHVTIPPVQSATALVILSALAELKLDIIRKEERIKAANVFALNFILLIPRLFILKKIF